MAVSQLNARQIDIFNTDHVRRIVAEVDNEQNRRRKRDAWEAYQCRSDNQLEYVRKEILKLYPKTGHKFRLGNIKIAKKIVEKKAKAYKSTPVRRLGVGDEFSVGNEELNNIYDEFNFHRSFKEADDIFNLHKYIFMWLTWQNASEPKDNHDIPVLEGGYVLHALAPFEYDLIRDQVSGEPLVFILAFPDSNITRLAGRSDGIEQTISESQSDTSAQSMIYKIWTPDKYVEATVKKAKGHGNDHNEEFVHVVFDKKEVNPLDRLPGGFLQADTAVDYPVRSDLAVSSVMWNTSFSDLKTAASTQGHGQLVIKHPEGQKQKDVHMGMHTSITLAQSKKPDAKPTEADYISANPDLAGQLDVLKFDLVNILDDEGIKAKGTLEGGTEKFASGFDRLISEADVQDIIEDNQSLYSSTIEQDVYSTLKAYEETMGTSKFGDNEKLEVHFDKPKVLISDAETLANIEKRDELGTLLAHEKHMILNPNLTEEQAMEREEEIRAAKDEEVKRMQDMMGSEEESEDDEDNETFE